MRKALFSIILIFLICIFASSVKELLRAGDHFFKRGEYYDALSQYNRALEISPDDENVLWRIGAAYNRISMNLMSKARNDTFKVANDYLTRALHKNHEIAQIHSELAWNLTYMGLLEGDFNNFAMARRVKEEIDYALSIDPEIAEAHFLLGLWHRTVGKISILKRKPNGLGDASVKKAVEEFGRAVELNPDCALFRLELARQNLIDGDTTRAFSTLESIKETPGIPANKPYIKDAQEILDALSGR